MDTRTKILTLESALALPRPRAVAACEFNVLRAQHARLLAAFRASVPGHTLLAVVLPVTRGILPRGARAELAAGLRVVQWVTMADSVEPFAPDALLRLQESDVGDQIRRGGAC